MQNSSRILGTLIMTGAITSTPLVADPLVKAFTEGKAYGDFRLRFEHAGVDAKGADANAFTLRSRIGYRTGEVDGFSGVAEFEDVRTVVGIDEYTAIPGTGSKVLIADPETTELDQAYIQYKGHGVAAKVGRFVLTYDNHRHIGHVGWRQDRQTYDGATATYKTDDVSLSYSYLAKVNGIFAEERDTDDAAHHLFNASYKLGFGKLTTYSYLLENRDTPRSLDTYGVRLAGKVAVGATDKVHYTLEYAHQDHELSAGVEYDVQYALFELGYTTHGITAKFGYEVLSEDNNVSFQTPLATLHKFNGWSDYYLPAARYNATGLQDRYLSLGTKVAGGKLLAIYHDYVAEDSSVSADDLGSEINFLYAKKFGKHYNAGIKYAGFMKGDAGADLERYWAWVGFSF